MSAIKTVVVTVAKNLTRAEAMKQAWPKARRKGKADFRAFTYNPTTGRAALT